MNELTFQHSNQSVSINGIISDNKKDQIKLNLHEFNLANLNLFTSPAGVYFKGIINGESIINSAYKDIVLTSNFDFKSLYVNGNEIGKGDASSVWDQTKDALYLHCSFTQN